MFISDDYQQALEYAQMLHSDNTDRREADRLITEEALKLINDNQSWSSRKSTVVYQSHWHKGVVGIVASRLIDHYYRPTIVLTQSGEYVAGSARSVAGFNVYEAIHQCKDLLLAYGGHFYAAGMTMSLDNVVPFQLRFEEVVSSIITDDLLIPEITIDAEVRLKDLTPSFFNIVSQMEPFGPDNVKPVFVVRNVVDTGYSKVVKDLHLKLVITQDNIVYSGIAFNFAQKFELLADKHPVDVAFTLDENEWNGNKYLQMKVLDMRRSENLS
jgi:single-stranded-DNA-specific exonuclease